jgi:hypothetical protein
MNEERLMSWNVAQARRRFAELLARARRAPQPIYRRSELVGAVVGPDALRILGEHRKARAGESLAQALFRLREICAQGRYRLLVPPRRNRRQVRLSR